MKTLFRCLMLLALALMAGCADYRPTWFGRPSLSRSNDYYARSDLDELLRFGADMAKKPGSARAEECRRLLKFQREAPGIGVRLHLLAGRLLSESCGDARKIAEAAASSYPSDIRVQWLAAAQSEALKRLGSGASRRSVASDRKQKSTPDAQDAKPDSKPDSRKDDDEAKRLREKLEQIRSLERKLDESNDGE